MTHGPPDILNGGAGAGMMASSPSAEALAAMHGRIARLRDRAVALQGEIRAADYRGRQDRLQTLMPGGHGHHHRCRAADIMQLIAGSPDPAAVTRTMERAMIERANSSKDSLDDAYAVVGAKVTSGNKRLAKAAHRRRSSAAHKSHSDDGTDSTHKRSNGSGTGDDEDDTSDDEEEENVQQAVARIQAITRSREARDQYLRLRMVTQSMQERRAAIARGEAVKEEEDEDGLDDVDVEKEEDEDE